MVGTSFNSTHNKPIHMEVKTTSQMQPKSDPGFGKITELVLSILLDLVGLGSYFIPGVGELTDIATAPLNVAWILEMFNDLEEDEDLGLWGDAIAGLGGLEELAPFIDIIPSATIAWGIKWIYVK